MKQIGWIGLAAAATAAVAAGWFLRGEGLGTAATLDARSTAGPAETDYIAATRVIEGTLSASSRERLAAHDNSRRALLILLRAHDRMACEDLGRQLRAVLRAGGPRYRALALVEPSAADAYRTWLRREHVRAEVVPIAMEQVFASGTPIPTPAVIHPVRFPNSSVTSSPFETRTTPAPRAPTRAVGPATGAASS